MAPMLKILIWLAIKPLLVACGLLYAGLVLMSYKIDRPGYQLRTSPGHPTWAVNQVLVWVGVKAVATILRAGKSTLDILSEASAEVGEWFLGRRRVEAYSQGRSRFIL